MRPRVDWMTRADDYILELLRDAGIATNPSTIGFNVNYDRRYVSERCRKLAENGLLERVDEAKAMYRITEKGRKYLAGELDAEDLED
jgi:predicted transcriptional regulator